MHEISKSDWKIFKALRELALERFCSGVLDEVEGIRADQAKSKHERYLAIYRVMQERDGEIEPIFDTLRRSTAVMQLFFFRLRDLVTGEELDPLSPELRETVEDMVRMHDRSRDIVDENDNEVRTGGGAASAT